MTAQRDSLGRSRAAAWYEAVPELEAIGIRAFTTTRAAGSFGVASDEPVRDVMARWDRLRAELATAGPRLATARQVHGDRVISHGTGWEGWLRCGDADGHFALERGTGMAVSIADCVPVFIAHASGAVALLHSGWRGTAARIVERAIDLFESRGIPSVELTRASRPGDLRSVLRGEPRCLRARHRTRRRSRDDGRPPRAASPSTLVFAGCVAFRSASAARDATTTSSSRIAPATAVANSAY